VELHSLVLYRGGPNTYTCYVPSGNVDKSPAAALLQTLFPSTVHTAEVSVERLHLHFLCPS
jgi:hypothetical protein